MHGTGELASALSARNVASGLPTTPHMHDASRMLR